MLRGNAKRRVSQPDGAARPVSPPADETSTGLGNRLLARLPPTEFKRIRPYLQSSWLLAGDVVMEAKQPSPYALFPVTSVVSLQSVLGDTATVQFAGVGNEGWLGLDMLLGGSNLPWRAVVQSGGLALRLPSERLHAEIERGGALAQGLMRYTGALIVQMATIAACNRRHTLERQLCRWLLLSFDRLAGDDMIITQELIASLIGVRREGITLALGKLQKIGLVECRRGHVRVLDRARLERQACECYHTIRDELQSLRG